MLLRWSLGQTGKYSAIYAPHRDVEICIQAFSVEKKSFLLKYKVTNVVWSACVELSKRWMSISSNTQLSHLRETKVFFDSNVLLTNVVSPCLTLLLYVNISRWVTLFLSLWFASEKSQSWTVLHNFIPRGNMCLLPRKILAPEPETRTFRMMYLLKCHVEKAVSNIVQHLHILSLFLWL